MPATPKTKDSRKRSRELERLLGDMPSELQDEEEAAPEHDSKFEDFCISFKRRCDLDAKSIKAHLDSKVIGQDAAKRQLSTLFSVHANRIDKNPDLIRTPNAVVIGPTGVGKTLTLKAAADYLQLPFASVDTTTLVPSGGIGSKIADVLQQLLIQATNLLGCSNDRRLASRSLGSIKQLAERGIIFFDEVDKIAVRKEMPENQNQIWLRLVQRSLLKVTEGATVQTANDSETEIRLDTSGILIIAGGAFAGITDSDITNKRPEGLKRALARRSYSGTASIDLVSYGFLEELVARLPVLIDFADLTDKDFLNILRHPEISPYLIWIQHFASISKKLTFTQDVDQFLVDRAKFLALGARGLHQVLFPGMAELTYDLEANPDVDIAVNSEMLSNALGY